MWVALAKSQKRCRGTAWQKSLLSVSQSSPQPDPQTLGTLYHNSVNFVYCILLSGLTSKPPLHKFHTNNLEPSSVPAGNPNKCTLTSQQACWGGRGTCTSPLERATQDAPCAECCKYVCPRHQVTNQALCPRAAASRCCPGEQTGRVSPRRSLKWTARGFSCSPDSRPSHHNSVS